jgi:hypothetical protein
MMQRRMMDLKPSRLPKAEVPESGTEPARGISMTDEEKIAEQLQIDQVRKAGAKNKEDIRKLFPEMNRQQAAQLRDKAWGKPKGVEDATTRSRQEPTDIPPQRAGNDEGGTPESPESRGGVSPTAPEPPQAPSAPQAPDVVPPPEPPPVEKPVEQPLRPDPPVPEDQFPPFPKGDNKLVTIQRRDGTTYRAAADAKNKWPDEIVKGLGIESGDAIHRVTMGKDGPVWSTGMLDRGEKIVDTEAPKGETKPPVSETKPVPPETEAPKTETPAAPKSTVNTEEFDQARGAYSADKFPSIRPP